MSRRFSIVYTMIVLAFVSAAAGCTKASNSALVPRPGAAGFQTMPQSLGSWTTKASMPTAREGLAVGVINGILYAVGGWTNFAYPGINTVEAYDPATDTWTTKAPMPTARGGLAAGGINGIPYATGGTSTGSFAMNIVEAYNPATNTWVRKNDMPTARFEHAVGVVNGKLYAVGGTADGVSPLTTVIATVTKSSINGTFVVTGVSPGTTFVTVYDTMFNSASVKVTVQ